MDSTLRLVFTGTILCLMGHGQTATKFEVASVKRSAGCADTSTRGGGGVTTSDSGRLDLRCRTVMDMIQMAYVQFAGGKRAPTGLQIPISGGPAWINSDRYDVDASAESAQSMEMIRGPVLAALLEERFQLRIHRESKDIPVYSLNARGGVKLQVARGGNCISRDSSPDPAQQPAGTMRCGLFTPSKANDGIYMYGTTLENFTIQLSQVLDRPVVDNTGIPGVFDIHIPSPARDDAGESGIGAGVIPSRASLIDPLGAAIVAGVEKAGLKIEPAKGMGESLVIDGVERPTEN